MPKHVHPELENSDIMTQAISAMQRSGLKRTKPREALLSVLVREHGPFSTEEIFKRVKKAGYDVVTVYRALAAFEKIGVVRRCDFGDGVARYEFQLGPHHHHHLICVRCRQSESLDSCALPKGIEAKIKRLGYAEIRHSLEFFGVCPACQKLPS